LTYEEAVTVQDAKTTKVMARLEQNFGALSVESEPPGAMITLNDQPTGVVTPHTFEKVQPGVAVIKLSLDGYGEAVERATIKNRETTRVSVKLTPKLGLLVVTSAYEDGTPCDGEVFVDGRSVGQTPWKGEVLATSHEVKVKCEKGEAKAQVTVQHNQRTEAALRISSRFVDNGDGTVTDKKTGLVWSKKSFGPMSWYDAQKFCSENIARLPINRQDLENAREAWWRSGDRWDYEKFERYAAFLKSSGWALPTIEELKTLVVGCPVVDECPATEGCNDDSECFGSYFRSGCKDCKKRKGPGPDGFYIDSAFEIRAGPHWSSAKCLNGFLTLDFESARVSRGRCKYQGGYSDEDLLVICVRRAAP
jgi:hypothetical protein